jgi:hypothetical protein
MDTISQVTDLEQDWAKDSATNSSHPLAQVLGGTSGTGLPKSGPLLDLDLGEDLEVDVVGDLGGASGVLPRGSTERASPDLPLVDPTPAAATYSRAKRAKTVAGTVRKRSRTKAAGAGVPSMEKAKRLTAERNLDADSGTSFSALDSLLNSHCACVLEDSCLIFNPSFGTPSEALDLIRAKEKAQAALAEATARKEAETVLAEARDAELAEAEADAGACPPQADTETSISRSKPKCKCAKRPLLSVRNGRSKRTGSK